MNLKTEFAIMLYYVATLPLRLQEMSLFFLKKTKNYVCEGMQIFLQTAWCLHIDIAVVWLFS